MNKIIKIVTCGVMLSLSTTQLATAEEAQKITIEEMEVNLAKLAKEIAQEKVKLYQKEALLNDMKLALLEEKHNKK